MVCCIWGILCTNLIVCESFKSLPDWCQVVNCEIELLVAFSFSISSTDSLLCSKVEDKCKVILTNCFPMSSLYFINVNGSLIPDKLLTIWPAGYSSLYSRSFWKVWSCFFLFLQCNFQNFTLGLLIFNGRTFPRTIWGVPSKFWVIKPICMLISSLSKLVNWSCFEMIHFVVAMTSFLEN